MTIAGRAGSRELAGLSLLVGLYTAACEERAPVFVPWPDELDLALIALGNETQLEITGITAFEEGRPRSGGITLPVPEDEEDQIWILGWSRGELQAAVPELDPDRWWALQALEDPEVCDHGSVSSDETRRLPLARLQPHAFIFELGPLSFSPSPPPTRALEGLAIDYPLRPGLCDARLPVRSARLDEAVFPPGVVVDGEVRAGREAEVFTINRLVRIDADRVITLGIRHLYHLRRGRAFQDSPEENILSSLLPSPPPSVPSGGAWWFTGLAIDPRSREAAVHTILVTASHVHGPDISAQGGGVFEVDVSEDGFVLPIRTSTVFWGGVGYPEALTVDSDGGWVAVGSTGLILTKDPSSGAVRRQSLHPMPWFRRITSTGHPLARHLAGSEEGFVAFGDLRGPLERVTVHLPTEVATSVRGLSSVPGERPRVFINTFASGALELGEDGTWSRLGFQTMGELGCASVVDACGFRTLGAGPLASEREGTMYSFSDRCGDLTAVDLEYQCAGAVGLDSENMTDLNASHGILTAVGERGRIIEMFLED